MLPLTLIVLIFIIVANAYVCKKAGMITFYGIIAATSTVVIIAGVIGYSLMAGGGQLGQLLIALLIIGLVMYPLWTFLGRNHQSKK